jgi:hypothetical protein
MTRARRARFQAHVDCDVLLAGALAHSCSHGPPPHRVRVVVLPRDNREAEMADVRRRLAGRPAASRPTDVTRAAEEPGPGGSDELGPTPESTRA